MSTYQRTGQTTWSYKIRWNGQQICRGGFTTRRLAEQAESTHRKLLESGLITGAQDLLRRRSSPTQAMTIQTILDWAEGNPTAEPPIPARVPRSYINCFRNFLQRAGVTDYQQPATTLNDQLVSAYKKKHETDAAAAPDQLQAARIKRTANSIMNQAKAMFSAERLLDLQRDHPELPNLSNFLIAMKARRFKAVADHRTPMPSADLIQKTIEAWQRLKDRNMFLAVGLELSCGLRAGEVAQARLDWLHPDSNPPRLEGAAHVKDHTGHLYVRPLDPWWTILHTRWTDEAWLPSPQGYLLTGTDTERTSDVFRRISTWLRELGWQTQKTNHAFRAYAGGLVTLKYGLYAAQTFLRHKSYTVTESHYSYLLDPAQRTMDPAAVPIRYAEPTGTDQSNPPVEIASPGPRTPRQTTPVPSHTSRLADDTNDTALDTTEHSA